MPKIWIFRGNAASSESWTPLTFDVGDRFETVELPERPWTEDVASSDAFVLLWDAPVHPKFFWEEAPSDPESEARDAEDLSFVKKCLASWKPIFGIGRGACLVAAYFGSRLVPNAEAGGFAELIPEPYSFLDDRGGSGSEISRPNVPRNWSQSLDELADELMPAAFSERWEILAAESSYGAPTFLILSIPDSGNPAETFLKCVVSQGGIAESNHSTAVDGKESEEIQ